MRFVQHKCTKRVRNENIHCVCVYVMTLHVSLFLYIKKSFKDKLLEIREKFVRSVKYFVR